MLHAGLSRRTQQGNSLIDLAFNEKLHNVCPEARKEIFWSALEDDFRTFSVHLTHRSQG